MSKITTCDKDGVPTYVQSIWEGGMFDYKVTLFDGRKIWIDSSVVGWVDPNISKKLQNEIKFDRVNRFMEGLL